MSPAFDVDSPTAAPPPRRPGDGAGLAERWPFLLALAAVALVALLVAALPASRYRAEALLLVPTGAALPAFPREALANAVREEAAKPSRPSLLAPLRRLVDDGLDGALGIRRSEEERRAAATRALGVAGTLDPLPGGTLAVLTVTAADPELAVRLANRFAASLVTGAAFAPAGVAPDRAALAARLGAAQTAVETLRRQSLPTAGGATVGSGEGPALALAIADARARQAELEVRVGEASRLSPDRDSPLDTPSLAVLRRARADLQMRRAGLVTELGPRHPVVAEIDQQLASAARQIDGEIARVRQAVASERDVAAARVAALTREAEALDRQVARQAEVEATIRRLQDAVDGARAALAAGGSAAPAGLRLAAPAVAATAIEPRPGSLVLLAGLGGLALGFALASVVLAMRRDASAHRRSA